MRAAAEARRRRATRLERYLRTSARPISSCCRRASAPVSALSSASRRSTASGSAAAAPSTALPVPRGGERREPLLQVADDPLPLIPLGLQLAAREVQGGLAFEQAPTEVVRSLGRAQSSTASGMAPALD